MAEIRMQKSLDPNAGAPVASLHPAMGRPDFDAVFPMIGGSVNSIRAEVDDAFADMKTFKDREPDEIMRLAGGHSARLSEIRVKIMRIEDMHPQWRQIRARDLEPTIEELQRQYQIASRLFAVRQLDWAMESGSGA